MGSMFNQRCALAKLRAEIEGREGRVCWECRKFGHLACNYRNKKGETKGKLTPRNKFKVIASRVMQCGVKEGAEIKRQEMIEEVKCFRCWRIGHYKWECPNIEVEKKREGEEKAVHVVRPQKVQQKGRPAHPNWEKVQEHCGVENVPKDAWILELGWMTKEVVATYIEYRWCRKKGMYKEGNRGQGVLRGKKLEEAKWCGCSKQRRKGGEVVHPTEGKAQQSRTGTKVPKGATREEGEQREMRRTFKILREVWMDIGIEKVDMHKGVTVKAFLDSGATGMFMDWKMAAKYRFRLQKLERLIMVRNVNGTNNSAGAITHQVEANIYYKGHVERMRMDVCDLGKTDVILGMPWLQAHNPEINWETGEVKITRCPPLCGRNTRLKGEKARKGVKRVATLEEEKIMRWAVDDKEDWGREEEVMADHRKIEEMVPQKFLRWRKVFGKMKSERMPTRKIWDHAIDLKETFKP